MRVTHCAIFPVVTLALFHKVIPHGNRGVLRDFFDFSAFCKHISGTNRLGKLIFDSCKNYVGKINIFTNCLKLMIELVEGYCGNAARFLYIEFNFLFA